MSEKSAPAVKSIDKRIKDRAVVSRSFKLACVGAGIAAGLGLGSALEQEDANMAPLLTEISGAALIAGAEHVSARRKLDKIAKEHAISQGVVGMSASGVRYTYTYGKGTDLRIDEKWLDNPVYDAYDGATASAKSVITASASAMFAGSLMFAEQSSVLVDRMDMFGAVVMAGFAVKSIIDAEKCTQDVRDIAELHIEQIDRRVTTFTQ